MKGNGAITVRFGLKKLSEVDVMRLVERIKQKAKTIRIYRQHDNHWWIEEEDLQKLAPAIPPDDSQELTLIRTADVLGLIATKETKTDKGMRK